MTHPNLTASSGAGRRASLRGVGDLMGLPGSYFSGSLGWRRRGLRSHGAVW